MRIALIGDLQYGSAENENLASKMDEVRRQNPDFAVVMGDFGGPGLRSEAGFHETRKYMDPIGCPWTAIMGNHDVEYSVDWGREYDPFETFSRVLGKKPRCVIEDNGVLVICITIERQPVEGMRTVNAVYVSDEQFEWVEKQLLTHPDMPTVLISHAPMGGSGLRCSPPLHSAATDTYMDQTFDSLRWRELTRRFPQIKAWCSAHYHMGHDYESAITEKEGVLHISCGVMTSCSRDGSRHTRFIDITEDKKLVISTLDHNGEAVLHEDAVLDLLGRERIKGSFVHAVDGEMLLGDDEPGMIWHSEELGRYYISTREGILWEYESELGEFSGAISLGGGACALSFENGRLYVKRDTGEIFSVETDSPDRYQRIGGFVPQVSREERELCGDMLPAVTYTLRKSKEGLYVKFA